MTDASAIDFRRHRAPPALRRGACRRCRVPVVNFVGPGPLGIGFVPAHTFENPAELPEPTAHIFYDRRSADVADATPKCAGYWASEACVTRMIFGDLLRFGRTG